MTRRYEPVPTGPAPQPVLAICNGGHRVWVSPKDIGKDCWVWGCAVPMRLPDEIDERIARHEAQRRAGSVDVDSGRDGGARAA